MNEYPHVTDALALQRSKRRNYQACLECKKHKVKCRLGDSESPRPPCVRCRRAQLSCVFGPARRLKPRANATGCLLTRHEDGSQAIHPEQEGPAPGTSNEANCGIPSQSEPLHPVDDTQFSDDAGIAEKSYNLSSWQHLNVCRAGYLSPHEANHLLEYFFQWMHPLYPLLEYKYSLPHSRTQLITEEPLLCTTILVVASRYTWYRAKASSSKAIEAHSALYRHLQLQIQRCMWASDPARHEETNSLGLIESIMLMVEWHPRPLDVITTSRDITGSYALESYGYYSLPNSTEPTTERTLEVKVRRAWEIFKPLNTASWRLLCIAVNLADELGIYQIFTVGYENRNSENEARREHVREFLVCLVWERCVRLGRKCLINHSFGPWKPLQNEAIGNPLSGLLQCRAELYRLSRRIENTLDASCHNTKDNLTSWDYRSSLKFFLGLLAAWRAQFDRHKESSAPLRKHLEMTWHNTRLFLFSTSLRAAVAHWKASTCEKAAAEASGNASANLPSHITIPSDQVYHDCNIIEEMIKDAEKITKLALELHQDGLLRHAPLNVIYYIASASLILLRIQRLPFGIATKPMNTFTQLIEALEDSSVDDAHASSLYASLLKDMTPKSEPNQPPFPTQASEDSENPVDALASELHTVQPAGGTHGTAIESVQTPCRALEISPQEALLAFDFNDEWLGWMNF